MATFLRMTNIESKILEAENSFNLIKMTLNEEDFDSIKAYQTEIESVTLEENFDDKMINDYINETLNTQIINLYDLIKSIDRGFRANMKDLSKMQDKDDMARKCHNLSIQNDKLYHATSELIGMIADYIDSNYQL